MIACDWCLLVAIPRSRNRRSWRWRFARCAGYRPAKSRARFSNRRPRPHSAWCALKNKILEARIPYQVPDRESLPERLDAVLGVIYLVFNEGYAATDTPELLRPDLCIEAIRLARLLAELMPEAEVLGLLALMLLRDSRRDARVCADGAIVPFEEQDRTLWNRSAIDEGLAILHNALLMRRRGAYQVQAAIAALHAEAACAEDTDWKQIAALYGAMTHEHPGAVVELNAAVALAMAEGAEHGLVRIEQLSTREELDGYHLLPAAMADLLRRLDRLGEARENYRAALALVRNPTERKYLERRLMLFVRPADAERRIAHAE